MKHLMVMIIALLIPVVAMAKGECGADKQKFCKDLVEKEAITCLKQHMAELSEVCKAKLETKAKEKSAEEPPKQ
jgi:hypothetical protein